jgi:hypothetical protein
MREVELEVPLVLHRCGGTEDGRGRGVDVGRIVRWTVEHRAEVLVDRRVVVDDQDAAVVGL